MSEMVERVARAIYEHSHEPSMRWEDSPHQPAWYLAACYAIQAMREPTRAMLYAAGPNAIELAPSVVWKAMIDEALK